MKVIIIAGAGLLPVEAAKGLRADGHQSIAFVFASDVEERMREVADHVQLHSITQIGKVFKAMKESGAEALIFAGKFQKITLEQNLKFDLKALWMLATLKDRQEDTIMYAIVAEIEKLGIKILNQTDVMRHLILKEGIHTKIKPKKNQMQDIKFAFTKARGVAGLDIGQSIIVKNRTVFAIESFEGTDQTITRGASFLDGGFTFVKVAKPHQDLRFDLPVIGMDTLRTFVNCKGAVASFEAGKTLIIGIDECIQYLNDNGASLVGYVPEQ